MPGDVGVLPASHLGKSRSGIGFAYKNLAINVRHDGVNAAPVPAFLRLQPPVRYSDIFPAR